MHTTNGISASIASIMAAPATGGGTKITEASASVSALACDRSPHQSVSFQWRSWAGTAAAQE